LVIIARVFLTGVGRLCGGRINLDLPSVENPQFTERGLTNIFRVCGVTMRVLLQLPMLPSILAARSLLSSMTNRPWQSLADQFQLSPEGRHGSAFESITAGIKISAH
jgi:hypothetical protein